MLCEVLAKNNMSDLKRSKNVVMLVHLADSNPRTSLRLGESLDTGNVDDGGLYTLAHGARPKEAKKRKIYVGIEGSKWQKTPPPTFVDGLQKTRGFYLIMLSGTNVYANGGSTTETRLPIWLCVYSLYSSGPTCPLSSSGPGSWEDKLNANISPLSHDCRLSLY